MDRIKIKKIVSTLTVIIMGLMLLQATIVLAVLTTSFSQIISDGTKTVDIVDAGGTTVVSPAVSFGGLSFSFIAQTGTGTLGVAGEKIRVYNPTSGETWTVSIAATDGATSYWDAGGGVTYDFNDSNSDGTDDADADAIGGKLTLDPSAGTLAAVAPCASTANISKGTANSFKETAVAVPSISLLTAAAGAPTYCRWDFTGISLSQVIPAVQASGTYTLSFTITIA